MSVEAMTIALHHSRAQGTAKVVLLGIANHDGDGGAWPSIATLAKYANVSTRSVQRAIDELQVLGEVSRGRQQGGTARTPDHLRPNLYAFTLTCPPDCDRSKNHVTDADQHRHRGAKPAASEPTAPAPKPAATDRRDLAAQETATARAQRLEHPERCAEHQHTDVPPPCGACARARRVVEAAEAERDQRQRTADAERLRAERAERTRLARIDIDACGLCDDDGRLRNGLPCKHDPALVERNARGRAAVDAALAGARA
ncbi:helix-turn-helix domain-containing protein [Isoptericola dokdonensis]|uniref:Helix-turn-helix domain-containing protein n=1 Tax=Isoptericola dokdonensis DS-3 TaxID=1300344 RepID=A0A161HYG0_9MICO|nr:helix-turn-helix domain-containing protein [Isoptericola dokdonensis]ANC31463.1 hypothetical protein I598_1915 [Isoptericola dokdonensis DS-3]